MFRMMKAKVLAAEKHSNQKYGNDDYYCYHLCGVVTSLESCGFVGDHLVVGYLHDVLEDTDCTELDILNLFGKEVLTSVIAITKNYFGEETRQDYLSRCAKDEVARVVKIHDASFNMLNCAKEGNTEKFMYYVNTIMTLEAFNIGGK